MKVSYSLFKRTAVFTLLTFTLMVISANYSFAKKDKFQELKNAEELYENGDYGSALQIVDKFIFKYSRDRERLKDEFCLAYLIKAKIYYDSEDYDKMITALRNLFRINIEFNMFQEENPDFVEKADKIRQIVKEEEYAMKIKGVIAKPGLKKKKKFPVLLVVAGIASVAAIVLLLSKKKKEEPEPKMEYTLNVTREDGVNGTPASGSYIYEEGTNVNYNYSLQDGYANLAVTLDGRPIPPSGIITMNSHHTLMASSVLIGYTKHKLEVALSEGVEGEPPHGTHEYAAGTEVSYSYTAKTGYTISSVKLDGVVVPATGKVLMDKDHQLTVTVTAASQK